MKYPNGTQTLKSRTLGLALAAFLIPAGMASAHDRAPAIVKTNLSGHVEVVHQVPGGVVTVGADWGKQRQAPQVVVVEERPQVIIVEKRGRRYNHRDHRDHGRDRNREVTLIREQPRRQVTVIHQEPRRRVTVIHQESRRQVTIVKTVPARKEVVVVRKHDDHGYDRDGRQRIVYVR
ncbi:MAG TPA: hypothetical protein VJ385_22450 [Fibrobacteria bacterium]|nr:hypothetical protein [Fibrobacteria bacterium]